MPANQYDVLNLVLIAVDTLREEFVNENEELLQENCRFFTR